MKTERKMNIELLRILSMLMILLHHYVAHGGLIDIKGITINRFIGEFFYIGGKLGVVIFVLISGYFLIDSKFKIKKLLKLFFEVLFYSIIIYGILIISGNVEFSAEKFIKALLPISYNQYWFVTCYIGLYLFSPFINKLINNINKTQYKNLLVVCLISFVILPMLTPKGSGFYNEFSYFIFLYLISGYQKKYGFKFIDKKKKCVILMLSMTGLMLGVSVISTYMSQYISAFEKAILYLDRSNSFTILTLALSIFGIFLRLNINKNKIISQLAKCSFAVYLIHDNVNFKNIMWNNIFKTNHFIDKNPIILVIHIFTTAIAIYLFSTIIETIRVYLIEKPMGKIKIKKLENIFNRIDKKMNE